MTHAMQDGVQDEFLAQIADEVRVQGKEKRVLMFGDAWHPAADIYGVMFSQPVLEALVQVDCYDIHIEREPWGAHADQAVQNNHIKPEDYKLIHRPTISSDDIFGAALRGKRDDYYARGLQHAAALGNRFHLADSANGVFKTPQQQKQYLFAKQERERQWVGFLLKNKGYFDDPVALIGRLIHENRERYARRNIDLECLRPQHQPGTSPWRIVRQFWEMDRQKDLPDVKKLEQSFRKNAGDMMSVISERQKRDAALSSAFNRQSKGDKFAVFYGSAHLRNQHGGFLSILKPEEAAVFHIWPGHDVMQSYQDTPCAGSGLTMWQEHIRPDDIAVVIGTQQVKRTADIKLD